MPLPEASEPGAGYAAVPCDVTSGMPAHKVLAVAGGLRKFYVHQGADHVALLKVLQGQVRWTSRSRVGGGYRRVARFRNDRAAGDLIQPGDLDAGYPWRNAESAVLTRVMRCNCDVSTPGGHPPLPTTMTAAAPAQVCSATRVDSVVVTETFTVASVLYGAVHITVADRKGFHAGGVGMTDGRPPPPSGTMKKAAWDLLIRRRMTPLDARNELISRSLSASSSLPVPSQVPSQVPSTTAIRNLGEGWRRTGRGRPDGSGTLYPTEQLKKLATTVLGPTADNPGRGRVLLYLPADTTVLPTDETCRGLTLILYALDVDDFHSQFEASSTPGAPPPVLAADGKLQLVEGYTVVPIGLVRPVSPPERRVGQPPTHRFYPIAMLIVSAEKERMYTFAFDALEQFRRCTEPGCIVPAKFDNRSPGGFACRAGCRHARPEQVPFYCGDLALAFRGAVRKREGTMLGCYFHDTMAATEKMEKQHHVTDPLELMGCYLCLKIMRLCTTEAMIKARGKLLKKALRQIFEEQKIDGKAEGVFNFLWRNRYGPMTEHAVFTLTGRVARLAELDPLLRHSVLPTTNNNAERFIESLIAACRQKKYATPANFLMDLIGVNLRGIHAGTGGMAASLIDMTEQADQAPARAAAKVERQWAKAAAQVALGHVTCVDGEFYRVKDAVYVYPYLSTFADSGVHGLATKTAHALQELFRHHDAVNFPALVPHVDGTIRVNVRTGACESADLTALIDGNSSALIAARMVADGVARGRALADLGNFARNREMTIGLPHRSHPGLHGLGDSAAGTYMLGVMQQEPAGHQERIKQTLREWKKFCHGWMASSSDATSTKTATTGKGRRANRKRQRDGGLSGNALRAATDGVLGGQLHGLAIPIAAAGPSALPAGASDTDTSGASDWEGEHRPVVYTRKADQMRAMEADRVARKRPGGPATMRIAAAKKRRGSALSAAWRKNPQTPRPRSRALSGNQAASPAGAAVLSTSDSDDLSPGNVEYDIDRAVCYATSRQGTWLRVRWEGFGPEHDSWEPIKRGKHHAAAPGLKPALAAQLRDELDGGSSPELRHAVSKAPGDAAFHCERCTRDGLPRLRENPW